MGSRCRYVNEDPLGFTKQTETILIGLGAGDLIPQFRKRNISSQGLASLSKQDLMVLGADENLATEMWRQLRAAAGKYGGRNLSGEFRTSQLIKIVEGANRQLHLLQTFISYARLRLAQQPLDFVVDYDKNVRASQALCAAAACIIADVETLEKNRRDLIAELSDSESRAKKSRSRVLAFFAGVGITAGILCALRHVAVHAGKV